MNRQQKSRKKKASGGRIAMRVCVMFFSVLFILSATGFIYIKGLLNQVPREEITGNPSLTISDLYYGEELVDVPDSIDKIKDSKKQFEEIQKVDLLQADYIQNILLIGSDTRNSTANGLSDTVMLASINKKTNKIHLVSFMRAMYVNIPTQPSRWWMLNAAYSWGGPKLLMQTLESNFRVKIDDFVVVDFSGFEQLINIVGGVEIELTSAEAQQVNRYGGGNFTAGTHTLNGKQALAYARIRKIDTDFKRTGRQRQVVEKLIQKAVHMNLGQLNQFANQLLPLINTSLSDSEILSLATSAPKYINYAIDQMMLPIENDHALNEEDTFVGMMYVDGMEMYKVNYYANVKALHSLLAS